MAKKSKRGNGNQNVFFRGDGTSLSADVQKLSVDDFKKEKGPDAEAFLRRHKINSAKFLVIESVGKDSGIYAVHVQ